MSVNRNKPIVNLEKFHKEIVLKGTPMESLYNLSMPVIVNIILYGLYWLRKPQA